MHICKNVTYLLKTLALQANASYLVNSVYFQGLIFTRDQTYIYIQDLSFTRDYTQCIYLRRT